MVASRAPACKAFALGCALAACGGKHKFAADGGLGTLATADDAGDSDDAGYLVDDGGGGLGSPDSGYPNSGYPDSGYPDSGYPNSGHLDSGYPDSGYPDSGYPADSGAPPNATPCLTGPGWTAFRFHYADSTSPVLDAFGLPDASNFEATPVFSTSIADRGNGGGVELAGGNWILIRFSVRGLARIDGARFSVFGRSYDTTAGGSFNAWSPLYGDDAAPADAVSNAWPYAWTSIGYTGHVAPQDDPGLTGIRLYAGPSSNDLVVHAIELCLEGN